MRNSRLPLVTIGIPTFNRIDGYFKQTLTSALEQSYPNIEVVVSDNCSTDGTESYMKGLSASRLRYFRQKENIGPARNFNFCLEQAQGDYFLLLNDDDLIDGDFIETCMVHANYATDIGIIQTGTRIIDAAGEVLGESRNGGIGLSTEDFFRAWFAGQTSWYLCNTVFNTGQLRDIGGFQSKRNLVQDGTALVQLAAKSGKVIVQDVKASFRKHSDEITFAVKVKDWCEDYLALLDLMCDLVDSDHERIREEGMRFLSKINYNRASSIASRIKRFKTYLMVYRMFNYSYSPWNYLIHPKLSSYKQKIKKNFKHTVGILL